MANDFGNDVNSGSSSSASSEPQRLRFGAFDLDTGNRELRRRGLRVKLQQKPFQILHLLTAQAGKYVTRGELARHLWPDLHVNFDRSLNTAMNSLRRALGDSPDNPRFIETRSGLGYRFIAPVERICEPAIAHPAPAAKSEERVKGNLDAYHDYLKGRYFQNKRTEDDLRKSVAYFEAALQTDPDCALAYAGLSDTYSVFAASGVIPSEEARSKAREYAMAALAIDGQLAEGHAALGTAKMLDWDWAAAEAEFRKAVSIQPGYAHGRRMYATFLSASGKHEEAVREIRQAHALDPLSLVINAEAAWILYMARDYQEAMQQAWRTLAMEPQFGPAQHALGLAYQQMGMLEEAIVELQNARKCWGHHPAPIAALGHAHAAAGQRREAEDLLHDLESRSAGGPASAYWIALLQAGLGKTRAAIEWLEKACDSREAWVLWLEVEPRLDSLRGEDRLRGLVQRIRRTMTASA